MMKRITLKSLSIFITLLYFTAFQNVEAQSVFLQEGNIFYIASDKTILQLTKSGHDFSPVLCLNKQIIVFLRNSNDSLNEMWEIQSDGKGEKKLLTETLNSNPSENMSGINHFIFSLDCGQIYFNTEAWATSPAVHKFNRATGKESFVADGLLDTVISQGEYKNFLIVNKHKYYIGGGSYDWFWIVDPESGNEIGPIGESTDIFFKPLK